MMWWIIGYMVSGVLVAEGATWNKRTRPESVPDVEITPWVYSVLVIWWLPYLLVYLYGKWRDGR